MQVCSNKKAYLLNVIIQMIDYGLGTLVLSPLTPRPFIPSPGDDFLERITARKDPYAVTFVGDILSVDMENFLQSISTKKIVKIL